MDVIEKAKELGELLMDDDRCKRMQVAKAASDSDPELQSMIGEFNLIKLRMRNEYDRQPPDDEKLKASERELKAVYADIMSNKNMAEYNEAKKEVDELVSHINSIIQISISGEADEAGCNGSCESCQGCH